MIRLNHVLIASTLGWVLCVVGDVSAHGGGLDKHGCHNDRKRGGYHCHRGSGAPSLAPAASAYDLAPTSSPKTTHEPARITPYGGAYANCAEARAAGAAPVRRGDPGYGPHLDRDGDGVGCEPRRR